MHDTAWDLGQRFIQNYVTTSQASAVMIDIGSGDINGSLKQFVPNNVTYYGLDFEGVENVDVVLKNAYEYPFADNSVDFVVSSSCFEHSEFFWLSFKEIFRVLKPSGVFYLNAPANGVFHRHPMDYWRFYPDAGIGLMKWAGYCGHANPAILESFVAEPNSDIWRDYVGVFLKNEDYRNLYPTRILDTYTNFTNGLKYVDTNYRKYKE
jgi:SAM-dependent methyltransferase